MEWTPRWFNKNKFHLLKHLREHIRLFGPAILFATEAQESFNAVIRAWCINSNRLAPSRDTASRAAHLARVRHLASGGYYSVPSEDIPHQKTWITAGPDALEVCNFPSKVSQCLDSQERSQNHAGMWDIVLYNLNMTYFYWRSCKQNQQNTTVIHTLHNILLPHLPCNMHNTVYVVRL